MSEVEKNSIGKIENEEDCSLNKKERCTSPEEVTKLLYARLEEEVASHNKSKDQIDRMQKELTNLNKWIRTSVPKMNSLLPIFKGFCPKEIEEFQISKKAL